MTLTTHDKLVNALANNASRLIIEKASMATQIAGQFASMWRSVGQPGQGAIPTGPAVPTSATLGAVNFMQQTAPATTYLGWLGAACSTIATLEVHDRLAHNGGLVLNVTTPQAITGLDLLALAPSAARVGSANYDDVQWWLEVYAAGGATASNATINVTFDDGSTGDLALLPVASLGIGRMLSLSALRTVGQQGKNIRGINTVTLSASTGTAGNFGFTATRPRSMLQFVVPSRAEVADWAALGMPEIPNDSCLFYMVLCTTTSTGTIRGSGKLIHG